MGHVSLGKALSHKSLTGGSGSLTVVAGGKSTPRRSTYVTQRVRLPDESPGRGSCLVTQPLETPRVKQRYTERRWQDPAIASFLTSRSIISGFHAHLGGAVCCTPPWVVPRGPGNGNMTVFPMLSCHGTAGNCCEWPVPIAGAFTTCKIA